MGAVPLARHNLFQDRRRAALSVSGLAVALLLVLVLDGIFAGAIRQVTAYLRSVPADVVVSQRGVTTMHMSSSALPGDALELIRNVRGVEGADAIRYTSATLHGPEGSHLAYVIGYDVSAGRDGPWKMARGRAPETGQMVLDEVAADHLGVDVGGTVEVLGRDFTVSGISEGGTSITNTTAFVPTGDFAAIRGSSVSYVFVRAAPGTDPAALAARLEAVVPGSTAQTKRQFIHEEANIVRDMSADLMQIMSLIAFLIALAVIALTLFTATLAKLREYAVVKAIGATSWRLSRTVVTQAIWAVGLAVLLAVALALAVGAALGALTPNVRVVIEVSSVARSAIAAAIAGAVGALIPLRRVLRLDPATAFRR